MYRQAAEGPRDQRGQGASRRTERVLFPTIDFAIFFGIVFIGNWLLAPFPKPLASVHPAGELRLLRLVGLAVRLPAGGLDRSARSPGAGSSTGPGPRRPGAPG